MATNYVRASFQEIYDMRTAQDTSTFLGIHTPVNNRVHQYLHGFFTQYKQFRYDGCSMVFIPVSQLPVDPLQVGTEAGYVDPRDLVNPIIHCGIHGESLGDNLNRLFKLDMNALELDAMTVINRDGSASGIDSNLFEQMYYTALSSPSFQKSHVQSGFRKSRLFPLYYRVGTDRQLMPVFSEGSLTGDVSSGSVTQSRGPEANYLQNGVIQFGTLATVGQPSDNYPYETDGSVVTGQMSVQNFKVGDDSQGYVANAPLFFSAEKHRLGWLDTLQDASHLYGSPIVVKGGACFTALPKLYMYLVMLPPCYLQKLYFRVVLTHHFSFRSFRSYKGPMSHDAYSEIAYSPVYDTLTTTLDVVNGDVELVTDGVS